MPALKILLISDGRPGHFNLAEGIIAAIGRRRPIEIHRLQVKRRLSGSLAAALFRMGLSPAAVLRACHGLGPAELPAADVIVSAGAETLPANVAAARMLGVPNIFYGSLRSYRPEWFSLSLTSYAEHARSPHPVLALKPSRLDPAALSNATPSLSRGEAPRRAGLLIGGNGGGTRWSDADWADLVGLLISTHKAHGTRWTISNSRRTPDAVSDRLAGLAAEGSGGAVAGFVDVRRAGAGTLGDLLAGSEVIAVTADSSSMLSEAVWSRRPVVALCPRLHTLTPQEASYRRWLEQAGRCRELPVAEASPARLLVALELVTPLAVNPLDELAALLAVHLPGLMAGKAVGGP